MTGRGCSVDGCERRHKARGMCKTSAGESPGRVASRLGLNPEAIARALCRRGENVAARPYWALDQRQ